jgi:fermentation-respiration switch protein FrsA (DUF1100 family)
MNRFSSPFINVGIGTLLLLCSLFLTGCSSLFFYPQKQLLANPVALSFSPENVLFKTEDGLTLHGWFFRAGPGAKATILVLHGNAENISTHVNSVLWLINEGFNVFIFDYRGYGRSEGKPTLPGMHRDAEAALKTLQTLPGVDHDRIIVLGQSLGGAVAVYAVAITRYRQHIKALIIDSAFSSYRRIAREKLDGFILTWPFQYPLSLLFNNTYSPEKWIGKVSPVPLLILHGERDTIVPVHHAETLFDAAGPPKELWLVPAAGHIRSFANDIVRKHIVEYLERVLEKNEAPAAGT